MTIRAQVISTIEEFLIETKMSDRKFGAAVAGDTKFCWRLRRGYAHNVATLENALAFVDATRAAKAAAQDVPAA